MLSRVRLCNPMDCSLPSTLSMEFSRQEYWTELPFPTPGVLPETGIEPGSSAMQADSLPSEPTGKSQNMNIIILLSWLLLSVFCSG